MTPARGLWDIAYAAIKPHHKETAGEASEDVVQMVLGWLQERAADPQIITAVAWAIDPIDGMEDEGRGSLAAALAAFVDTLGERP